MTVPYTNEAYMGAGDLFIARYDANGDLGPSYQVGNTEDFVINAPDIDKAERNGKMRQNWGNVVHTLVKSVKQGLSFTLTDINRRNLALAMFGTDTTLTQTGGSDGSAIDVTAKLGAWVAMGKYKLDPDNAPVVKDDTDTTTYVEGTDYEIDYQAGSLMAIDGGSISADDTLHVTRTWLAYTGFKIAGHANTEVNVKLELLTQNKAGGSAEGKLTVYKATLEPSGDMAWLSEDYIDLAFSGEINTVTAGTYDYEQF